MKILFEFKLDRNHAFALSLFFLHFPACGFFLCCCSCSVLKKEQKDSGKTLHLCFNGSSWVSKEFGWDSDGVRT